MYIDNNTIRALAHPQDMISNIVIQLQLVFSQWIQNTHTLTLSASFCIKQQIPVWLGGRDDLGEMGDKVALLPIHEGSHFFLVHHIHTSTIHIMLLVLLKDILFARNSRLILDKANIGFCFSCEGLIKGEHVNYPHGIM